MKIKTNCLKCGKDIFTKPSHHKLGKGKYCSLKCSNSVRKGSSIPGRISGHRHSEETKEKISLKLKGRSYGKGKVAWWKIKGLPHPRTGTVNSEETKSKLRKWNVENPFKKFKDASIEIAIENELIIRNINYQKQVPLCKIARVDFYLPEHRAVIQCDGTRWHNLPGRKEHDSRQDAVLTFNGFNVYRFTDVQINESAKKCVDSLSCITV